MLGAKSVVAADANVLLSAVAGRAAVRVLASGLEIHTTEHTWAEVLEYVPKFQERYKRTIEEQNRKGGRADLAKVRGGSPR